MKILIPTIVFLFYCVGVKAQTIYPVSIVSDTAISGTTVGQYQKFEIGVVVNPSVDTFGRYDYKLRWVYAVFKGPNGEVDSADGFWYSPFRRCDTCSYNPTIDTNNLCGYSDNAVDSENGPEGYLNLLSTDYHWRIRFATGVTGKWHYKVYAHDNPDWPGSSYISNDSSAVDSFTVVTSSDKGYIKVAPNGRNFSYADNSIFIPLGLNTEMPGPPDSAYNRVPFLVNANIIPHMAARGGNFVRLFMYPKNFGMEWLKYGAGNYEPGQDRAFDMDSIVEAAAANNVYIQMDLDVPIELVDTNREWAINPYKAFVSQPKDFFSDANCRRYYKNKLRYAIARWGYSPHLFSLELYEEVDKIDGASVNFWDSATHVHLVQWTGEMMNYCRAINKHLLYTMGLATWIGTGLFHGIGVDSLNIYTYQDYISDHYYDHRYNDNHWRNYMLNRYAALAVGKPMIIGEYNNEVGINSFADKYLANDEDWHIGLWSQLFSGSAGPGIYWPTNVADIYHDHNPITNTCWGGQDAYFLPIVRFLKDETLFSATRIPHPIANPCTGTGPKDTLYHDANPLSNRCHCHLVEDSLVYSQYTSTGVNTTNDSLIEVFGLKNDHRVIGWIHSKQNYWYLLPRPQNGAAFDGNFVYNSGRIYYPDSTLIPVRSSDSVTIGGMHEGNYKLEFYSTYPSYPVAIGGADSNGGVIDTFTVHSMHVSCDNLLKFKIPTLRRLGANDWSAPYAPDYGFKASWTGIEVQDTIKGNTVWSASGAVPHDTIVVDSGAILSIQNCTVEMASYGVIKVLPGGQLIVDHATIKGQDSACHMWSGIQAVGNAGAEQYPWTQGWVKIGDSSVIEGALVGVSNWDGNLNLAHTGGAIQAINGIFLNNLQAISFHPYHNLHPLGLYPDLSDFTLCNFIVDRNLKASDGSNSYAGMVFLNDVLGIDFEGCNFINRDTAAAVKGHGTGIFSNNSGYYVFPVCTALSGTSCSSWKRGYFNGFERGILAEGNILSTPDFNLYIDRCDFDSNRVGVHIKASDMSSTTRCNFNVGHAGPLLDNNGSTLCYENVGIIIENAHTFRIEADSLYGNGNMYSVSNWKNLGVLVENTGSNNNTVYKNYFNGLDYGCYTVGNNYSPSSNPSHPPGTMGLRFRCNYFTNDTTDIYIDGGAGAGTNPGVAAYQGDTAIPASNYFATGGSIINYGDSISYYFDSTPGQMRPGYLYPGMVDTIRTHNVGTCPNSYDISNSYTSIGNASSVHLNNLQSAYNTLQTSLISVIITYEGLVAAGDSNARHMKLQISVEGEAMSDTAAHIMRALKGLHHGSGTCGIVTDSTSMWYRKDSNNYYTLIDSVAPMLQSLNSLASQYELAGYYHFKNPADAMHRADSALVHAKDSIKTTDSVHNSEYAHMKSLWKIIKALDSSGRSVYQMTDNEKDTLTTVGRDNGDDGEEGMINLASASQPVVIGGLIRADPFCNPYSSGHKPGRGKDTTQNYTPPIQPVSKIRADCMLNAYPNPANNFVSFGYRVPDAGNGMELVITDAVGREIKRFHIKDNSGIVQWDIRQLSPGMYVYVLKDGAGTVGMGKLVIE